MADDWQTPEFRQCVVARINEVLQNSGQDPSKNGSIMENHIHKKARTNQEYLGLLATLFMRFTEMVSRGTAGRPQQPPNANVGNANVNAAQMMPKGINKANQMAPGPEVGVPALNQASGDCPSTSSGKDKSKPEAGQGSSKRGRHDESSPNSETSKRPKLSAVDKVRLRVAVVDYANPERKLTDEQWRLIELKILEAVNDAIMKKEEVIPLFGQQQTLTGFRLVECDNPKTLEWLERFIAKMAAPWPNADLRVVDKGEIMNLTKLKGRIHIQGPYIPKEWIERNLQHLNPEVGSQDWEVIEMGEYTENGMDVDILLGHKSLSLLRQQNFRVRVGTTLCRLRVPAGKLRVAKSLGVPP